MCFPTHLLQGAKKMAMSVPSASSTSTNVQRNNSHQNSRGPGPFTTGAGVQPRSYSAAVSGSVAAAATNANPRVNGANNQPVIAQANVPVIQAMPIAQAMPVAAAAAPVRGPRQTGFGNAHPNGSSPYNRIAIGDTHHPWSGYPIPANVVNAFVNNRPGTVIQENSVDAVAVVTSYTGQEFLSYQPNSRGRQYPDRDDKTPTSCSEEAKRFSGTDAGKALTKTSPQNVDMRSAHAELAAMDQAYVLARQNGQVPASIDIHTDGQRTCDICLNTLWDSADNLNVTLRIFSHNDERILTHIAGDRRGFTITRMP
jgi:hypothetical protein